MSLFQPQLESQPQAQQRVVADNSGLNKAIETVGEGVVQGVASYRISNLQEMFNEINQASATGGDVNFLRTKARTLLNRFKADTPALAKEADSAFASVFGGGGSGGGLFEKTPEEKGREAAIQKISEKATTLGVSMEAAQERFALDELATGLKNQAEVDKYVEGKAAQSTERYHQVSLQESTVWITDLIQKELQENGGIGGSSLPGYNMAIKKKAAVMEANLLQSVLKDDGTLAISTTEFNRRKDEITAWAEKQSEMVKAMSRSGINEGIIKDQTVQGSLAFAEMYPSVVALSSINQQAGAKLFEAVIEDNPRRKEMIRKDPKLQALFNIQGSFDKNVTSGLNKILVPGYDPIVPAEAAAVSVLLGSGDDSTAQSVFTSIASNNELGSGLKMLSFMSPEVLDKTWKPNMARLFESEPEKYGSVLDGLIAGGVTAFHTTYSLENGKLPETVKIVVQKNMRGEESLHIETPDGLGGMFSQIEVRRNITNQYRTLKANPTYLRQKGEKVGNPNITAEEYLSVILGTKPVAAPSTSQVARYDDAIPVPTQKVEPTMDFGEQRPPRNGDIVDGYKYIGGALNDESSWEKVDE